MTDPNGNAATYTYDAIGRITSVKAPGDTNTAQIAYVPGTDKIDHITLPEGNSIYLTYDTNANLVKIADSAGNSVNYTYDSDGNKLTEDVKDASNVLQKTLSFQYDALNQGNP